MLYPEVGINLMVIALIILLLAGSMRSELDALVETERAFAEFVEAQRLSDNHYPTIASLKAGRYFGVPKFRALYEATFFVGLRKAGMPEE